MCSVFWFFYLSCHYLPRDCLERPPSLSLRFNSHFPDEPGLASVYWSKGWW